ncbi:DNA-binding protein [Mesorhizobium sp. M4B.F.Ca.ET.017.02.2.1]|uniref:DNA-binding protein n=1 Tax=Mesorhizobium sp. M4B.F.Ca.ET.017.02.2.1 TaxID=2496649 RepID=UPI000FCB8B68|nr:DNA-binding protein [Mesorhizobium sp. M4B.F.Ca.ET.017.02.2.1]RVD21016.1 DNA-binding protein [Mesorhizobium sp. M4B.F.Ca.ET.017.02.2.1]
MEDQSPKIDLVWGCAAIARVIRRTPRQCFYMLENGTLPAKKVGGRWVIERGKLLALFLEDVA